MKKQLYISMPPIAALLALLLMLLSGGNVMAQASSASSKQKKEQLQSQMKKLQDEIKSIEAAIKKTGEKKKQGMAEILSLQAKIKSREKLINNINSQIGDLEEDIDATQADIAAKSKEVEKMKADYASMLRKSYSGITLQNKTAFILSASSFDEAIRRYNYMLKVADYRRNQAKAIQVKIGELEGKKVELEDTREKKEDLLVAQTQQKGELESEKKEKDKIVTDLGEKEKKLRARQQEKNKAAQALNSKIKDIIEQEIASAKKKAEQAAKSSGKPTPKPEVKPGTVAKEEIPMTPQEMALSKEFVLNKGKLPWPVTRGHVISHFGKQQHPVIHDLMIENNGIDIRSTSGAEARAVFGGTVVSVFSMPTVQNCVLVKHGEFYTVYSNLASVSVKSGQNITTKQSIGTLYMDKDEGVTKVHIELWQGKLKLNPEDWLIPTQ
jgi:septal ring factor EnvC (AmiA/AmiB activator)